MIGAIAMIFALVWIYQSGIKAKTDNLFMWIGICAAVFLASQVMLYDVNIYLADLFNGKDVSSEGYERDLVSVGDRKNQEGFQSAGGAFLSYFLELMPPLVGFLILAFIRLQFVTKESFSIPNLFSGINEMVSGAVKSVAESMKQGVKK
ncbi:MAG: hypothetical protein PHH59_09840 [Methylovulum sp.]|uniref:hypothetical protein n=1 Tax=Methylovulum sp. TaxID=1916980 RepID=UPI002630586F|nr:hypothetical protein [Methylovulum sp.]MDD2724307.1 hypothetical protein [Methylovulum sp.]MDD5122960.1 hypothetical protein [Methylovulum sp.]